jgi:hypothetical protein
LPGNHLEIAGTEHADGFSRIGDGLQEDRVAQLVDSAASRHWIDGIKCGEVKTLPQDENISDNVTASTDIGLIVAP